MWRVLSAVLALVTALICYFVIVLYQKRAELDDLPHPPFEGGRFWGNLKIAGDCKRLFPPNVHVQNWIHYIRKKYDLGDVFYVDWWPLGPRWLFIADPELVSKYITTGQSLPKSRLVKGFLTRLLGPTNMVGLEGQAWKSLRTIFNPGFAASHLTTLVSYMVDSSLVFLDLLHEKAASNELVQLDPLSIGFAIDVIGKVVMDSDFDSQKKPHPIVTTFRRQVELMPSAASIGPLDDINLIRPIQTWWNARKLDNLLGAEIDMKVAERKAAMQNANTNGATTESKKERKRTIVDLALDAYEKEMADSKASGSTMGKNTSFRNMAIDSVKTFIFAGHDTTSATISYTMYLLHLHPHVYKSLMEELDEVFGMGTSTKEMAEQMKSNPHILNKLEYLGAINKEVLRLFPPASTIRELKKAADIAATKTHFIIDPSTGKQCPLAGFDIWPVAHMIHRNETFFPHPIEFIPERFLPNRTPFPEAKLHTPAGKDAWRPFEKGPRNCIGQELAMMEIKVVLALVVREIDFTAEFDGVRIEPADYLRESGGGGGGGNGQKVETWTPIETRDEMADDIPGTTRMTIEGHKPFQILFGAARPKGGMPGRLSVRKTRD